MAYALETNKYRIVLLAVQRAKQLRNGATQRISLAGAKSTRLAIAEVKAGMIGFDLLPVKAKR